MKEKGYKERERENDIQRDKKEGRREKESTKYRELEGRGGVSLFYKAPTKIIRKGKKRKNKENE